MKEELKKLDLERVRLIQMLEELQGMTEDGELETHDMTINLRTKSSYL